MQVSKAFVVKTLLTAFLFGWAFQSSALTLQTLEKEVRITNQHQQVAEGGTDNTRSGVIVPDYTFDVSIPANATFSYDPETGQMTVYTTDGQQVATMQVKDNGSGSVFPVTVKDRDGKLVQVDTEKNPDGSVKTGPDGKPVLTSATVTPLPERGFNPKVLTTGSRVEFEQGGGAYSLDNWPEAYLGITLFRDMYGRIALDYRVPWKFLPAGGRDVVTAVFTPGKGDRMSPDSIVFSTPQGLRLGKRRLSDNRYELTLVAGQEKDVQEVYALYPVEGSSSRFETLGKLEVVTYATRQQRLVLVPVNGAAVDGDAVEKYLNRVYNPVGVGWTVDRADNFAYADTTAFLAKGSGLLSAYTPAMRRLNAAYKSERGFEAGTAYLFVIADSGGGRDRDVAGFMPRGGQKGYVFLNSLGGYSLGEVAAHELGHGCWRLRHTFADNYGNALRRGSTDNLMDYKPGNTALAKWQWDQIVSPAWITSPFEKDEEGEINTNVHLALSPAGTLMDKFYLIKNGKRSAVSVTLVVDDTYYIGQIKYENQTYKWNSATNVFENNGIAIEAKKDDSKPNLVNLFKTTGDLCVYDYMVVPWTKEEESSSSPDEKISAKIATNGKWLVYPYTERDLACNNNFIKEVLANDRKDCSAEDIEQGYNLLKNNLSSTDPEHLASVVNSLCLSALRKLECSEKIQLFNTVAGKETLKENSELAALRLMNSLYSDDYKEFYKLLEKDNNRLLIHLVDQMDDASAWFWTDRKNYTNFIGALVAMFNQSTTSIADRWPPDDEGFAGRVVNLNAVDYSSDTSSDFNPVSTLKHNSGDYDSGTGNITLNDIYTTYSYNGNANLGGQNVSEHTEKIGEVSPLTPIVIVPNTDKLPLIATALGESSLGNNGYIVPAILLKYQADKIRNDYLEKGILVTLDLATVYLSGGTALATKVSWVRRAWAMAEVAGAVGNIAVNTGTVSPEVQKVVDAYNLAMGIIGVKNLAVGGYKFVVNLPQATRTLLQENKGLRDLISAKYLEWNSLIMKYKSPEAYINTEVRKAIEEQGTVLGQLSGKVLRKFNDSDEISQFLKTDKDGAFFWSGRTSKGKDVADMALEIAQGKGGNTLEGMLAKYNIDMPTWDASNPAIVKIWEDVSALYATQVSGEVRAVLGKNLRPGNIWEGTELPRLKKNPNVTKIITIDPETMIETIIFTR